MQNAHNILRIYTENDNRIKFDAIRNMSNEYRQKLNNYIMHNKDDVNLFIAHLLDNVSKSESLNANDKQSIYNDLLSKVNFNDYHLILQNINNLNQNHHNLNIRQPINQNNNQNQPRDIELQPINPNQNQQPINNQNPNNNLEAANANRNRTCNIL
jgi:hypothetical protein